MAETKLPVVVGLSVGIAFIVLFSQASFEPSIGYYTSGLIDSISPIAGFDDVNRRMAIDILLQNSTVVESLRDKNVHISAIALMKDGCSFGTCARVVVW